MSDLTLTPSAGPARAWAYLSLSLAVAAAVVWVLAGVVDDGLYLLTGILGVAGLGVGLKARRASTRAGARSWPALAGIVLGGLLGGAVFGAFVYFVVSNLVS